jgi:arylsulfatase A-like enzyme
LGEGGYIRGLWGKDHIIRQNAIGILYDEGEDICLGNMDSHPAYRRPYDSAPLEADSPWNLTRRLTDGAMSFIERNARRSTPFFVTINYQDPHPFFSCPEPWASLFKPEQFSLPVSYRSGPVDGEIRRLSHWRIHGGHGEMEERDLTRAMAMYCGQIRYVDDQIGRVMAKLEELQLLDETIVLFWSDHGEFLGDFGVTHKMPAFYDCLMRVPLVLWDPTGCVQRGTFGPMVETMDAMATVLELCGLPQPDGSHARSLQANNFEPRLEIFGDGGLFRRQPEAADPTVKFKAPFAPTSFGPGAMVRTDDWKLCLYAEDEGELFDLENDPHETRNLYHKSEYQRIRLRLSELLGKRLLCKGASPRDMPG